MKTDDPFGRSPDIWYGAKDNGEIRFWCIEGVWHWRVYNEDGTLRVEGLGQP